MFKKIFQTISDTLAGKEEPKPGSWGAKANQAKAGGGSLLNKISSSLASSPGKSVAPSSSVRADRPKTPEELCGIEAKMPKEEIKARLALLYRRYNRATSSLDAKLRAEAETMLDAVVAVREKTFGPI